jgi:hypothetical protein
MFETYRMLGRDHEVELERVAGIRSRGARRPRGGRRPARGIHADRALAGALRLALTKLATLAR